MPDASPGPASDVADRQGAAAADAVTTSWARVKALFDAACAQPPAARAAVLAGADVPAAVRAEVEALLAADADAPAFLDRGAGAYATLLFDMEASDHLVAAFEREAGLGPPDDAGAFTGARLGAYRLAAPLGRGGMGTVYLAERADGQFEQQAAIKLLRAPAGEAAAARLRARFRAERQILAGLDHPGIARLLDGGLTPDPPPEAANEAAAEAADASILPAGQPYLVMEYVDGVPLDAFCDDRRLDLRARLRLFCQVGEAVQAAHRRLVVHRDLKPSNILVALDDAGRPQVKLLDFGIAKVVAGDGGGPGFGGAALVQTQTGEQWMTPAYAAPEQVRGAPVTTATDVYQLGAVLYELLTGLRPHDAATSGSSVPYDVAHAILHDDPVRPSVAAASDAAASPDAAASDAAARARRRGAGGPRRLARRLRGDLDTIALKALRKEPDRRYASAEALVDDVRRHLDGLPVAARADTVTYRAGRFMRRHRALSAAVAALAVLVVGYAVTVTVQAQQVRAALGRAETETAKAEAVSGFLMDLFAASDPTEAVGDTVTARELLARGEARAEALADEPATQAQMLGVIGQTYRRLGRYDRAAPLLARARTLRDSLHADAPHPDRAASLHQLALLRHDQGAYAAADSLYAAARAQHRALHPPDHPDRLVVAADHALLFLDEGRYDEAVAAFRALHARQRAALPEAPAALAARLAAAPDGDDVRARQALGTYATILNNLALTLHEQGDLEAAEACYREGLALDRVLHGDAHPEVATSLNNLAAVLRDQGRLEEAEAIFRETLGVYRRIHRAAHPQVAAALNNLGRVTMDRGRHAEAEPICREAVVMYTEVFGAAHPRTMVGRYNLALALAGQGRHAEAARRLRAVVRADAAALGADHPEVGVDRATLAQVLRDQAAATGEAAAREAAAREADSALVLLAQALPPDHPRMATVRVTQASLRLLAGAPAEAAVRLEDAVAALDAALGAAHPTTAQARGWLGACRLAQGRYAEAEPLLRAAHDALAVRRVADAPSVQRARQRLAALYDAWGRPGEAMRWRQPE